MKKLLIFIFFAFSLKYLNADIINELVNQNYIEVIKENKSGNYIGTIIVRNNKLELIFESDIRVNISIVAYEIESDIFTIIVKERRSEEIDSSGYVFEPIYYKIEITNSNGNLDYTCTKISEIKHIGITYSEGRIFSENIGIINYKDFEVNESFQLRKDDVVEVIAIINEQVQIGNHKDFIYQIVYNNNRFYVCGYFVDFYKEIILRQ